MATVIKSGSATPGVRQIAFNLEDVRQQVDRLGLSHRFHLPGQVRNVPDYLAAMDLFLLTSRSEGLPNSLVEAQFAGVPVVSTNVGGAMETFLPGRSGQLTNSHSPGEIANVVTRCLADEGWLKEESTAAQEFARNTFTMAHYSGNLKRLYAQRD